MNLDKMTATGQFVISVMTVLAFFASIAGLYLLAAMNIDFPPGAKETLLVLLGVLAGGFKDVLGFQVGSSIGSQRKDITTANAAATLAASNSGQNAQGN